MENIQNSLFEFTIDADGIGLLSINQVDNPANLLSTEFIKSYISVAQQAIEAENVKGVIVTSARSMFIAGADLREMAKLGEEPKRQLQEVLDLHKGFRALETGGKPFVAAINGTTLGGGLELCLTCHHRIALNSPRIKIGFPEVKVGLLPGGGGTVKTPYLLGIQQGLTYLLQGLEVRPDKALKDGLVDELAENQETLLQKAKDWILNNPNPIQPWDNKKHRMPGGGFWSPNGVQTMMGAAGNVAKLTHGKYPAAKHILSTIHDGLQVPIDQALAVEARYFIHTAQTPEAKNMIRTGFMAMQEAKKGKARPKAQPKYEVKKLGILGAGMMGAGIAYVSAKAGMEVVLKDVSTEQAEKGKAYSQKLLEKAIRKKRSTPEKAQALLERIHPTDDPSAVGDCDFVIEAVFEDTQLKHRVTQETEAVLSPDKIYGSNTSTIPISLLAKGSKRPENFIGIHFFSPVEKMPLVEIIVGEKTEEKAIAAAVDYTLAIKKIPIVVNDSRGFYTSRCFSSYCEEGLMLLSEGVPPAMIENIARHQGLPVGPLAVMDEVSLSLGVHIYESDPNTAHPPHRQKAYQIQKDMVENGREGKKTRAGFYDYPEKGKKKLWPGLAEKFTPKVDALEKSLIAKRLMHRQALESYRCLDEGILRRSTDGDIGSILGWGFPIYTGGTLSYIDYVGIQQFVADCDTFMDRFGERWKVPDSLRKLAKSGKSVHHFSRV